MKSILVIGMGRFGTYLALKLTELGNQVMIADKNEDTVNRLAHNFTDAVIGDCSREEVLAEIGVNNFDICFVTMGESFQASLEVTSLLKDMGAKHVVSMSGSEIQSKFLLRNGADEVVYPEKDLAFKTAVRYNADNIFDFIQLGADYGVFEIKVPEEWAGKNLGLNVLAIKHGNSVALATSDYVFRADDHVIVAGAFKNVDRLQR